MKSLKRFRAPIVACTLVGMIVLPFWLCLRDDHQRTLDTELIAFMRSGSIQDVRSLLKQGADPNARDLNGVPPESMLEHVIALVTRKHSLEFDNAPCALLVAIDFGMGTEDPALVRLLLEYGADVNLCEHCKEPPLLRAEHCRSLATVRLLLDHGANANLQSPDGTTALVMGINSASPEIVQLLLDHGAQVHTQKASNGRSDLDEASSYSLQGPYAVQCAQILTILKNAVNAQGK
jgi:hypothetical protein